MLRNGTTSFKMIDKMQITNLAMEAPAHQQRMIYRSSEENSLENRRITIGEVPENAGIWVGSCHAIFSNVFGMRRVSKRS